jgi:hypothetical protein
VRGQCVRPSVRLRRWSAGVHIVFLPRNDEVPNTSAAGFFGIYALAGAFNQVKMNKVR